MGYYKRGYAYYTDALRHVDDPETMSFQYKEAIADFNKAPATSTVTSSMEVAW